jgi:hypothetical protein
MSLLISYFHRHLNVEFKSGQMSGIRPAPDLRRLLAGYPAKSVSGAGRMSGIRPAPDIRLFDWPNIRQIPYTVHPYR